MKKTSKPIPYDNFQENISTEIKIGEFMEYEKKRSNHGYVFYCIITVSVALYILAFVVTEALSGFFGDGRITELLMGRLLGEEIRNISFSELMLERSFTPLVFKKQDNIKDGEADETLKNEIDSDNKNPEDGENTDDATDKTEEENKKENGADKAPNENKPDDTAEDIYYFDRSSVPNNENAILPMDLSASKLGNTYINNETDYKIDTDVLKDVFNKEINKTENAFDKSKPIVLIIHTHGTESYTEKGKNSYSNDEEIARSTDITKNVVSVGARISELLNANGIPTIHSEEMYDKESYKNSYARSAEAIREYLEKYPSIKYVFDIHRDSVLTADGSLVRAVARVGDDVSAQVMSVVGSDANGTTYDTWQSNLAFSLRLREELNLKAPNLSRPTYLKKSSYNQQMAQVSLLIEVGTSGNTQEEALVAAEHVAAALSKIIYENR